MNKSFLNEIKLIKYEELKDLSFLKILINNLKNEGFLVLITFALISLNFKSILMLTLFNIIISSLIYFYQNNKLINLKKELQLES